MIEVKGNGNIVSKEHIVSSFIRLHLGCRGTIELIQSDEEKVVVETDENLQDYFEIVNSGRTLYVTSESKLRKPHFTQIQIRVYVRQVDTLYIAMQGDVVSGTPLQLRVPLEIKVYTNGNTSLNVQAPSIKLRAACNGNITLKGSCGSLDIRDASNGNLDCREMIAGHVKLRNASAGNISLYSTESIVIQNAGAGDIHYYGPGVLQDIRQYGAGELRHMGN